MQDNINHPPHYKSLGTKCLACKHAIECIDVTENLNFNLGNAVKYVWRAGFKGKRVEDLKKAIWYLNREVNRIEDN